MQLSILLLVFYSLHIVCSLIALKTNIKYQITITQRKVRMLSDKTIAMQSDQIQKQRLRNFCRVYVFLFKKYTLIGLLFTSKPAHSIVILFSFAVSYIMSNFGIHWAVSSILPFFSSLISIAVQYEYYKSIFYNEQQEDINKISKLMSANKAAIVIYTFFILSSLAVLFFLIYTILNDFKNNLSIEKLIANGLILALDNFINKPLSFILVATIASQSSLFLQMIQREDNQQNATKGKRQLELKGVINFSQQQLNDFVKEGDYELKQTKKMFASSIFNKKYEPQNQFVKSKSINHISCKNEFFFLPDHKNNSSVKKEDLRLKAEKTVRFFAINQLEMNTQYQLNQENQTKSLEHSKCHNATNTRLYEISSKGKTSNSERETKTIGLFSVNNQNKKIPTDHTQNTLSDIYTQKTKTQQQQKSKFSKPYKQNSKQTNLMKVQQLETEMQEEINQRQLKEHSTNTVHAQLRARKRRPTAIYAQKQQQNLIKIYLDGNKQQIKDFKPRRRQSQISLQIAKRYKTSKHIDGRSKPIVHQSQQQPNIFKLCDV